MAFSGHGGSFAGSPSIIDQARTLYNNASNVYQSLPSWAKSGINNFVQATVNPVGSLFNSAQSAMSYLAGADSPLEKLNNPSGLVKSGVGSGAGSGAGSGVGAAAVAAQPQVDYFAADLAKRYGMDATTAYQEALLNTQYQRSVADMQAAGLNPVLAAKYGGAGSGVDATPLSSGSGGSISGNSGKNSAKGFARLAALAANALATGITHNSGIGRVAETATEELFEMMS